MITARDVDAPKGCKLEFEMSGKLKKTSVVAAQRGTKVVVEAIFHNRPVRKKELEKNIKREYGKVLSLLQAYACISTGVRFVVSNQMPKASKNIAFSTSINNNTKDNITNVFGVKTLHALVKLDLGLQMNPTKPGLATQASRAQGLCSSDDSPRAVTVQGHISRPVNGEGRQAPDRQFLFVNSRPCSLPQVAKAFNEVYRSFNISQSPFIFANLVMDTQAYDVNVSPDKRTILLHDQADLLETLKAALLDLFEAQEQSVPHSKLTATQAKLPSYKPLTVMRRAEPEESSPRSEGRDQSVQAHQSPSSMPRSPVTVSAQHGTEISAELDVDDPPQRASPERLIHNWMGRSTVDREEINKLIPKQQLQRTPQAPVQTAFDRMRPLRTPAQVAEITIGDRTTSTVIGTGSPAYKKRRIHTPKTPVLNKGLRAFVMAGSQMESDNDEDEETEEDEGDEDDDESEDKEEQNRDQPRSAFAQREASANDPTGDELSDDEVQQDDRVVQDASALVTHNTTTIIDPDKGTQQFVVRRREFAAPQPCIEESTDDDDDDDYDDDDDNDDSGQPVASQFEGEEAQNEASTEVDEGDLDDSERMSQEDARIAHLTQQASEVVHRPSADNLKRASQALRGTAGSKHSVLNLASSLNVSLKSVKQQAFAMADVTCDTHSKQHGDNFTVTSGFDKDDAEANLSLTVTKSDFSRMTIAGQFNLGFIIAVRPNESSPDDDLFIIDQHAADEKFNFERLTRTLTLDPQRLAQPKQLYLTAVEEEIVLNHSPSLTANGFVIETDTSGTSPVGERCKLVSLPMSKETTFDLSDLEELLHLLSDHPSGSSSQYIPRPSKVRRMLAMRACRSSIMVGKTLNKTQMQKVVGHLGEMDKPWNCPHGRPTMRHLAGLGTWKAWDDLPGWEKDNGPLGGGTTDWGTWLRRRREGSAQSVE